MTIDTPPPDPTSVGDAGSERPRGVHLGVGFGAGPAGEHRSQQLVAMARDGACCGV